MSDRDVLAPGAGGGRAASSLRVTRRSFIVASGGFALGVAFGGPGALRRAAAQGAAYAPNAWLRLARDGTATLYSPAAEMGQGVMTALPLLLAEEMDLDWSRARVAQAPAEAKIFGNPLFDGRLLTANSRSVQGYHEVMRIAGLQARYVLMAAAARKWEVPVLEVETEPHAVLHARSGRKLGYGEIASFAEVPAGLPQYGAQHLKPASRLRLLGRDVPRADVPGKTNGQARFGIDVRLPQMLHATVLRAPVQGEVLEKFDDSAARKVPGVRAVVALPYGVGVIADSYWAARKGRAALRGQWSRGARARGYASDKALAEFQARARNVADPGVEHERVGDPDAALLGAARILRGDYAAEHVAHVCMEPMNCTALASGERLEIWAPTQSASLLAEAVARAASLKPENIACHVTLLGGGLGRRIEADYAIDAALLAKAVAGRPVKVVWTREDDIQHDKFRPLVAQHLVAALDAHGQPVALRHRIVAESIGARATPEQFEAAGGRDAAVCEGAFGLKYAIAHRVLQYLRERRGVDVGHLRGAGAGYTKFAIESFVDELAAAARTDPLRYRLALLAAQPRARAVLEEVARMAQWSRRRAAGRALGLAYSDARDSHVAEIAEVSVERTSGRIAVHEVWCAVDCGIALQPEGVRAQIESGVMQGLSHALIEKVSFKEGRPFQSNFHNYPMLKIGEAPRVSVSVLASGAPPGGVGEVGLPPIAPAVANAVAALTGVRLRRLPFDPQLLKTG